MEVIPTDERVKDYHLLGISRRGVDDCLPTLDVGDAFEHIATPALVPSQTNGEAQEHPPEDQDARQNLVDILSGHTVLLKLSENGYAP